MKSKPLKQYIAKKPQAVKNVMVRVDADLWTAADMQRQADGIKWVELIEASLKRYLDESK